MLKGKLTFELIKTDNRDYPIDGKVEPTFYNFGETDVYVMEARLKPGESFQAGATGFEMTGNVPVRFEGAGKKDCKCYFVVPEKC
ncbi:hypothetical protein SAMN04487907_101262 [Zunongwangia mangrovi]|uniref:Uncharacterized protein n=1 Tax=Zunongwangia mangrovi TaxID=1334022 RepID=A0A1I1DIJ5_9FLAO|nr:hypothetical protein [Zunongwangia mangrovi]SFB72343.1 hypothetical protein SAMN04487907_101262 [Zunongwangia mangrovi]